MIVNTLLLSICYIHTHFNKCLVPSQEENPVSLSMNYNIPWNLSINKDTLGP